MTPGGVFITFLGEYLVPRPPDSHNRLLDGHFATVQPVAVESAHCVAGSTGAIEMTVFLPLPGAEPHGSGQNLLMTACYAAPRADLTIRNITALIDSATFG